jgi:transcriptional regulator GlxA family with amidase domain
VNPEGAIRLTHTVGLYLFDEVEVLDFAGPFEVFSTAARVYSRRHSDRPLPFQVFTIGNGSPAIRARGGLIVQPQFSITQHPPVDVLIIPGGVVKTEMENRSVVEWIARMARTATVTASVCTGAFLLAQAGLLAGKRATTHWEDLTDLAGMFPDVRVEKEKRWIDSGPLITSAGISAGIDMSLHLVARLEGKELALLTAKQMEYEWTSPDS